MLLHSNFCLFLPFPGGCLCLILGKMLDKKYCSEATWEVQEYWAEEFIMNEKECCCCVVVVFFFSFFFSTQFNSCRILEGQEFK